MQLYLDEKCVFIARLFPLITAWVHEFKPATGILQPNARPAPVVVVLGIIAVLTDEDQRIMLFHQGDVDLRLSVAAHTMLEGIFHQRDEEQGCHLNILSDMEIGAHLCFLIAAQFHQFDVVLHKLHFTTDRHLLLVGLIDRIPQQVAELSDGILGGIGIDLRETGDVVEGVEHEMRVDLTLEPCQFCLRRLMPLLLQLLPDFPHVEEMPDADGHCDHHAVEHQIGENAGIEPDPCLIGHIDSVVVERSSNEQKAVVKRCDGQHVGQNENQRPALEEEPRTKEVEVEEIENERRLHHSPHENSHGDCGRPIVGSEDHGQWRQQQDQSPNGQLYGKNAEVFSTDFSHGMQIYTFFRKWHPPTLEKSGRVPEIRERDYCCFMSPTLLSISPCDCCSM